MEENLQDYCFPSHKETSFPSGFDVLKHNNNNYNNKNNNNYNNYNNNNNNNNNYNNNYNNNNNYNYKNNYNYNKNEEREYFYPFNGNSISPLNSPSRPSSTPYLDEYSGVAGQYFKDIMIPRLPSRKSKTKLQNSQEPTTTTISTTIATMTEKEYIYQKTACLPKLYSTPSLRPKLLLSKVQSQTSLTKVKKYPKRNLSTSNLKLPESTPFVSIDIPDSIHMLLFPYSELIMTQLSLNISLENELGIIVEAKKDCKYSDLKVSILNHSLRIQSLPELTKFEYSKLLNNLRVWAFDSKNSLWIPLRSQGDWDRVRISKMMETNSRDLQKLMYDDGTFLSNAKQISSYNDINDSITTSQLNSRRRNEIDHEGESILTELPDDIQPRLHLLTNQNKKKLTSDSPEKQYNMAKILEQRLLLSRI